MSLDSACGGTGDCGHCKVIIQKGSVTPLTSIERTLLTPQEIENGYRLACCTKALGNVEVFVPIPIEIASHRLQTETQEKAVEVSPLINTYNLQLTPSRIDDVRSDFTRLQEALGTIHNTTANSIDYFAMRSLSQHIREGKWAVRAAIRGDEIIDVIPASTDSQELGLAVDLGTTKIALYLVNLATGETVDSIGIQNPQASYGDDVVSRLQAVLEDDAALERQSTLVIKAINKEIVKMCQRHKTSPERILETAIVGNTAMHHILLKLPVRQLALYPFIAATDRPMEIKARELGLIIAPGAYIYFLPPVAGFVGSDQVAMLLASGIPEENGIVVGMDIGTNTEIALKTEGGIFTCSTASGPAFEGARIKDGIKAASGAIERVHIDAVTLRVDVETIADEAPIGLCGSGLLDALSEMLRVGIINESGRIQLDKRGTRLGHRDVPEFLLTSVQTSGGSRDFVITQQDVAELQLAKGAIRAGMNILLKQAGLLPEQIDRVIIAGAFGSYIDPAAGIALGMFPQLSLYSFIRVGNAAGAGAKAILVSQKLRQQAEVLARDLSYVELAAEKDFHHQFAQAMKFPEIPCQEEK